MIMLRSTSVILVLIALLQVTAIPDVGLASAQSENTVALCKHIDENSYNDFRYTTLMKATMNDLNGYCHTRMRSNTLIYAASVPEGSQYVELLLSKGMDINYADAFGYTALMHASLSGHVETVKLLLRHHANLFYEDGNSGDKAFDLAATDEIALLIWNEYGNWQYYFSFVYDVEVAFWVIFGVCLLAVLLFSLISPISLCCGGVFAGRPLLKLMQYSACSAFAFDIFALMLVSNYLPDNVVFRMITHLIIVISIVDAVLFGIACSRLGETMESFILTALEPYVGSTNNSNNNNEKSNSLVSERTTNTGGSTTIFSEILGVGDIERGATSHAAPDNADEQQQRQSPLAPANVSNPMGNSGELQPAVGEGGIAVGSAVGDGEDNGDAEKQGDLLLPLQGNRLLCGAFRYLANYAYAYRKCE